MLPIRYPLFFVCLVVISGCATAPRGPAYKVADAGMKTTAVFGTDVRALELSLAQVEASKAFELTWATCVNSNIPGSCKPRSEDSETLRRRHDLIEAIELRAVALNALHAAYAALAAEVQYDAKADLKGAVQDAVDAVNIYSEKVADLRSGHASDALISKPVGIGLSTATGFWADRMQKKRLLAASRAISPVTQRLHDALSYEAEIFKSVSGVAMSHRVDARQALIESGVVAGSDVLKPLVSNLGMVMVRDADALITKSAPLKSAVIAVLHAETNAEQRRLEARYDASLAALRGLLKAHKDFEAGADVSADDVLRFLEELVSAIESARSDAD